MGKQKTGFSLLELIIGLVIIGILSSLSYPIYHKYILRVHRVYMTATLIDAAIRMEKYYLSHGGTYEGANVANLTINSSRYNKRYELNIEPKVISYLLRAIPINQQTKDTLCGTLTIDQDGNKGASGSEGGVSCWL